MSDNFIGYVVQSRETGRIRTIRHGLLWNKIFAHFEHLQEIERHNKRIANKVRETFGTKERPDPEE